ncbi:hypothetical protein BOTBODRAFT_176371 [Botryobasidium botryosum FD-172 SS1]|uniref:hydroxymethylglutaryl-CoA lyase n=1 Tax=Botryobasidium botryosum (strain FD-172 SS1) TaxID=930990 RepID=A0A067MKN3_BOTB1|nr:hypothetical protein BOTBODRAFT_176371 [Botryobasidium botryosum FD-172 SS1]
MIVNAGRARSLRAQLPPLARAFHHSRTAQASDFVRIVEVGPRDGLQNEPSPVSLETKIELINKLGDAGLPAIEAGSFVSPKWVPQMAGTSEVLTQMKHFPNTKYPVLVPNMKGLSSLLDLLAAQPANTSEPLTDEIAIFVAASESFSRANINCSIAESLDRLAPVTRAAIDKGLRVRGYVSTVITCPFEGPIDPHRVKDVARKLVEMGCYEISLGDTVGTGTPKTTRDMIDAVSSAVDVSMLAAHYHDTYGMGVANVLTAVAAGIRTIDSSVAGLGGCPYSPGATGNVATEDVVHALHGIGMTTGIEMGKLVETGAWISNILSRPNASRAGTAWLASQKRLEKDKAKL